MPTYPSYQNVLGSEGTQGGSGPWGAVPVVPNPIASAGQAIAGDLTNFPGLESLAGQVNQFNTGQALAPYIANLPDYQNMVAQSSANISDLLQGRVPADVQALLGQQAAERGVGMGSPNSPNANSAYLRALGLTSLQEQQQGEQNLTAAIQRTPVPQLFNVSQYLTSPSDMQAAQMAANMYAAAPNPAQNAQALMDLLMRGMAAGRGMGGGGQSFGMAPPASGGFDPGAGGPPQVGPVGALGPFNTNRGTITGAGMTGGQGGGSQLGPGGFYTVGGSGSGGAGPGQAPGAGGGGQMTAEEIAGMFPGMSLEEAQQFLDYSMPGGSVAMGPGFDTSASSNYTYGPDWTFMQGNQGLGADILGSDFTSWMNAGGEQFNPVSYLDPMYDQSAWGGQSFNQAGYVDPLYDPAAWGTDTSGGGGYTDVGSYTDPWQYFYDEGP